MNSHLRGHIAALVAVVIWGLTFISTKVLLEAFTPLEILAIRFAIGYVALTLVKPHILRAKSKTDELMFAGAGLCGICLAFLFENYALVFANPANVSVLVATSPFFIGIIGKLVFKEGVLGPRFFLGFALAFIGIVMITFEGADGVEFKGWGELLALAASVIDAIYTLLSGRLGKQGYGTVESTKRMFAWGLVFLVPCGFALGFSPSLEALVSPVNLGNILFLALGASALCYALWNLANKDLGSRKAGPYIYLIPVVTVIAAALILNDAMGLMSMAGAVLVIGGLALSETR